MCENHPNELAELLPYVDILFGYVEEYKALNKFVDVEKLSSDHSHDPDNVSHDILMALKAISDEVKSESVEVRSVTNPDHSSNAKKLKLVVVTKGPSPLLYVNNHVVCEQQVPPVPPKDIIDTIGAGDSFVGGFLAALSSRRSVEECLDCGTWTAQRILQEKACSLPTYPAEKNLKLV